MASKVIFLKDQALLVCSPQQALKPYFCCTHVAYPVFIDWFGLCWLGIGSA
jgi:hypothetical protein